MISRIDHVSIAVRDYDKATDFFRTIAGVVKGAGAADEKMQYSWQIFSAGDLSRLELLCPTGANSFLKNFLAEKEGGVHHITFETPDILAARALLEKKKIPYFGFSDHDPAWKELFIHPKHAFGVLLQIAEFTPDEWLNSSVRLPEGQKWVARRNGAGIELTFAHPGGGKVTMDCSKKEIRQLIQDLEKIV